LPFKDFECEACGYSTDETESWVFAPEDMLVEVWQTVVADCGSEIWDKG
jgi:hypothetical protein